MYSISLKVSRFGKAFSVHIFNDEFQNQVFLNNITNMFQKYQSSPTKSKQ